MIIATWISRLLTKSSAVFDDTSKDEMREYLNDALILHRTYVRNKVKKVYQKNVSLTLAADGHELALPADMDDGVLALVRTSQHGVNPLSSLDYKIQRGVIVFTYSQPANSVFWIEYTAIPNYYEDNSVDAPELDMPDVRRVLENEVIASAIKTEDDFESSNAVNNLMADAANIQTK